MANKVFTRHEHVYQAFLLNYPMWDVHQCYRSGILLHTLRWNKRLKQSFRFVHKLVFSLSYVMISTLRQKGASF